MSKRKKEKARPKKQSGLDWDALREEFFNDLNPDGSYRYANVEEFGRHIARGDEQLYKLVVRSIRHKEYPGYEHQGDWALERLREETKHNAQVKSLKKKIAQEIDLLDVGKDVAQTYVPLQSRVERLFVELDEIYGGRPVLLAQKLAPPSPQMLKKRKMTLEQWQEDNKVRREHAAAIRFKDYMRCMSSILRLKRSVDEQLLDCLGWNRPQFIGMIAAMQSKGKSTGVTSSKVEHVMLDLVKAQLKKAEIYEMEMPEDFHPAMKLLGNGNGSHHEETEEEALAIAQATPVKASKNGHGRNGNSRK